MENKENLNSETESKTKGIAHRVGDAIEALGDKLEHSGMKKVGDAIEKIGDKVEHSMDKKEEIDPNRPNATTH